MIRKCKEIDYFSIRNIAYSLWSDEFEFEVETKNFIYDFLAKHYLYINDLSFVYEENDTIYGFSLAHDLKEENQSDEWFNNGLISFDKKQKALIKEYKNYLESNEKKVISHMNNDDVYYGFLASIKPGVGKALIENLKTKAKESDYKRIFFWTDETCDYGYYLRKGFVKVDEYSICLYGRNIKTLIFKIEL